MFHETLAYKRLQQLAHSPLDLTHHRHFNAEIIKKKQKQALGIKLLFAGERICDATWEVLFQLANERKALDQMQQMQAGKHVNTGEDRPALHTAMRAFSSSSSLSPLAQGFSDRAQATCHQLARFVSQCGSTAFDTF
ncbi:MAG: hypothetical protein VXZ72_03760, partial [Chlamydiota bacterium]|nr:hypothetical protein [Chlamydiota bacterium]